MLKLSIPRVKTPCAALCFFALLFAAVVGSATTIAGAAETAGNSANPAPAGIANFKTIQFMVSPLEDVWIGRVTAEIAEDVQLPATVEIAVPQHSAVYWFAEQNGTEFPTPYQFRSENGLDIYTGVLTSSRIIVLDYTLAASPAAAGPSMNVSYTPIHDVPELHLIAVLPQNSAVTDPKFEFMAEGPEGEPIFGYLIENATGGTEYSVNMPYRDNTGGVSTSDPLVVAGIALFVGLAAVGMFLLFRRNSAAHNQDEE